jgi:energy-coupling factor transporter ATP-binding protein EcfA2
MNQDVEDLKIRLSQLINNGRAQAAYPFIMIESIFRLINNQTEDINLTLNDIFKEFTKMSILWVNKYNLSLKEKTSKANQIISKYDCSSIITDENIERIAKQLMNSTVGKWVVPNITKDDTIFKYNEDRSITITSQVVRIINENMDYWRTENFLQAKDALYKYNRHKPEQVEKLFLEERYLIEERLGIEKDKVIEEYCINVIDLEAISQYLQQKGFNYNVDMLSNFYLSLKTKPFVILAGISGTGKSRLVKLFTEAIGGEYRLIPVKPDWSDATDLLGYRDINNIFHDGQLTQVIKEALQNTDTPYIICLDEMNLARVEYYLGDFLSLIESREKDEEGSIKTDSLRGSGLDGLYIPENVYIVGTVNMDETTFQFSKKVLDRANTIELSDITLIYDFEIDETDEPEVIKLSNQALKSEFLVLKDCYEHKEYATQIIEKLVKMNAYLKECAMHFAYRIRDEFVFYMLYNHREGLMSEQEAFDYQFLQKVLPRIGGTSGLVRELLVKLYFYCFDKEYNEKRFYEREELEALAHPIYPRSALKILDMIRRFDEDGFTSFWF